MHFVEPIDGAPGPTGAGTPLRSGRGSIDTTTLVDWSGFVSFAQCITKLADLLRTTD